MINTLKNYMLNDMNDYLCYKYFFFKIKVILFKYFFLILITNPFYIVMAIYNIFH